MAESEDPIVAMLRKMTVDAGLSQTEVSRRLGISQSLISRWLAGAQRPNRKASDKIGALYKDIFDASAGSVASKSMGIQTVDINVPNCLAVVDDAVNVNENAILGAWQMPDIVATRFRSQQSVKAFEMVGSSMEPTIPRGSFVFVDTSSRICAADELYAVDVGNGPIIRRLRPQPKDATILVTPDNPASGGPETFPREDVSILGRVLAQFSFL